ncbi:similar to Saccharomyces cerevisiae YOR249C APC5 Subunit of the Anaphase-Promoting Complex/Cyclosome (APC/C) [Maudiozyma saulgeensis]|uniref:Anaphase-promoting complex subunit 5 n=1 Tax=Maudiozyma saulgeensis TaxID=1789683 RepID=A0A1X7R4E6_9SACH|nr:similar to Saccharomyces cerevisiae YOR249C APC5 Subunit of the Anaphase-Promoting Complex/Cyclosome (APC/C) [Kazachstania saulgeensis]
MNFQVTVSLTPYDLAVLVFIYLHCIQGASIPWEVFEELIGPTIESSSFDPLINRDSVYNGLTQPLIPDLEVIIERLSKIEGMDSILMDYISCITSINTLETFYNMLKALNVLCLVKTSKEITERKKFNPSANIVYFTERSFLGKYVVNSLMKVEIGGFEDKNLLLHCFKKFVYEFKQANIYMAFKPSIRDISTSLISWGLISNEYKEDEKMIDIFSNFTKTLERSEPPDLTITTNHLENILDWYLYNLINGTVTFKDDPSYNFVQSIIDNITLHNKSLFPRIHIIQYLKFLETNSYEDAFRSLHNYFDYVLSQNTDAYFHISSLCLAAFYVHFHDADLAIKSFDEATKVARENRDSITLNLIIVRIIKFIESYPEHSAQFNVKVEQITRFLKSSSDSIDASIFENAYRFDSVTLFRRQDDLISMFEAIYKYTVLSMEQLKSERGLNNLMQFKANFWNELGFSSLGNIYDGFSKPSVAVEELNQMYQSLESDNLDIVKRYLKTTNFKLLNYNERMSTKMLQVRYLRIIGEYDLALTIIEECSKQCVSVCSDYRMKTNFEIEKCLLFLDADLGSRCLHLATNLLEYNQLIQNGPGVVRCVFILFRILKRNGKIEEAHQLLEQNMVNIMQYPKFREQVLSYYKERNLIAIST